VAVWWSIEVLDGEYSAAGWADAFGDALVTEALSGGASDWAWHRHSWGNVLELRFENDEQWLRFRETPAAQAALDAVPDPLSGLIIHRGRGGSAGGREPRRISPLRGCGAAALPLPSFEAVVAPFPDLHRRVLGILG